MQIVHFSQAGSHDIQHVGLAHDGAELEVLKAAARQRLAVRASLVSTPPHPPASAPPEGKGSIQMKLDAMARRSARQPITIRSVTPNNRQSVPDDARPAAAGRRRQRHE